MDQHVPALADAERAVGGLVFDGRIPPAVEVNHMRCGGEVQARPAGLERKHEVRRPLVALEPIDQFLPAALDGRTAVQHQAGPSEDRRYKKFRERLGHLAELRKNERFFPAARCEFLANFGQPGELAAFVGLDSWPTPRQLARVVAQAV